MADNKKFYQGILRGAKSVAAEPAHEAMVKYYPSFTVPINTVPEAKKWEIGKNYRLAIEVTQKAMRDSNPPEVTFEIKKIKAI